MKDSTLDTWFNQLHPIKSEATAIYRERAERYTKKLYFLIKYKKGSKDRINRRLNELAHNIPFSTDLKSEIFHDSIITLMRASNTYN